MKKNKNKLYTLSYFRKRLKDANISSKVLVDSFKETDKRYWIISIDFNARILCTCFKFEEEGESKYHFKLSDGKQRLPIDKTVSTESMNVIINEINEILNK